MVERVNKYRVWCNTDSKYVEQWNDEEPIACSDNNAHSIDPDKTVIIEELESQFPLSDIDGNKIIVHPSYKPRISGEKTTYAVWTGAGDDVDSSPSVIGGADLLNFSQTTGNPKTSKDVKFDHVSFGRVWIHEAYIKFSDGGDTDYISANIMADATQLQTSVNLDLVIDGNFVKFAPGGAGTGTHGFAGTPILLPRSYSKDGDWNYDGVTLIPNMAGTGGFKISNTEISVNRYINKIPCSGSCATYFSMTSDETAELPPGYFIKIDCYNVSDTNWNASVMIEIYRERTSD